ncbi:MAG: DnaJ domain-containing protein [Deltaproteobacteria bacterium]|nr:DnaJ domain-containing protein [Deltaproteobacteria bacterium]
MSGGLKPEDVAELHRLSEVLRDGTHYELLGVAEDFDRTALKNAYHNLSRRFHPDRYYRQDLGGLEKMLEDVFAGVNQAYRTLGDERARAQYDQDLVTAQKRKPKPKPPAAAATARPSPAPPRPVTTTASPPPAGASPRSPPARPPPPPPPNVGRPGGASPAAAATADPYTVRFTLRPPPPPRRATPPARQARRRAQEASSPAVDALKAPIIERLKKARGFFKLGEADVAANEWSKAARNFKLAMEFDPRNEEYKKRFTEADAKGRRQQAEKQIELAKKAESFSSTKEAFFHYHQAVGFDPPMGEPFYRLGKIIQANGNDHKGALTYFRKAVDKDPQVVEYRLALANVYEALAMKLNANREFKAILALKPDHEEAKAGLKRTAG